MFDPVPPKQVMELDKAKINFGDFAILNFFAGDFNIIRLIWDVSDNIFIPANRSGEILTKLDFDNLISELSRFYQEFSAEEIDKHNLCCQQKPKNAGFLTSQKTKPPIKSGYIYLIYASTGQYKIGYSINPKRRLDELAHHPPFDYELIHTIKTDDMYSLEEHLHSRFLDKRVKGEWFLLAPWDVEYIMDLKEYGAEE